MDGKVDPPALDKVERETRKTLVVRLQEFGRRHPTVVASTAVLLFLIILTVAAPYLSSDPLELSPRNRLKAPSTDHWFGTDTMGRDVYSRTLHAGRIPLTVGLGVAVIATFIGFVVGV